MTNLEFMEKFRPKERCLKEFKYWIICIRESQNTLGSAVILLKRETVSIGNITAKEAEEFPKVIKFYEELCIKKFGAVKFNYLAMMMHDNYVHCHAFPRYDKDINLFQETWQDQDWPKAIEFKNKNNINEDKLQEIVKFMLK